MPRLIPRMTAFDANTNSATVSFAGQSRQLPARRREDGTYLVEGFAGRFETGEKLWNTSVVFRERTPGMFSFWTTQIASFHVGARQSGPPEVSGYFDDTDPEDRGTRRGGRKRS